MVGLLLFRPGTALAIDARDQYQESYDQVGVIPLDSSMPWGQSFRPSWNGKVTRIRLYLKQPTDGTATDLQVTLRLYQGEPDELTLLQTAAPVTLGSTASPGWYTFYFSTPVQVATGSPYTFALTVPPDRSTHVGYTFSPAYADGTLWFAADQELSSWVEHPGYDLAFETYMEYTQPPTLATNAGLSVNEGAAATITDAQLRVQDSDTSASALTFTLEGAPANGTLSLGGTGLTDGDSFTQEDITLGRLTYTHNGSETTTDGFDFTVSDGDNSLSSTTFNISVTPVNDAPSFTKGPDQAVWENAGPQSVANWATAISLGETGQTGSFIVTGNTNPTLFAAGPAVAADGTLTFTPAADLFGSADITLQLQDNGGVANGGVDTSASQSFRITVDPINRAPSFTAGADQTIEEDTGAQLVEGWAGAIDPGAPYEAGQGLTFLVETSNNALFSAGPTVDPATGNLTYTPAPNAYGSATVTVRLQDDGGTDGGGVDTSAPQGFVIAVTGLNDGPVITAPAGIQNTYEETDLALGLTVTDTDAGSGPLVVSLAVSHGRLTLGSMTGLIINSGGSGQAYVSFSGTVPDINAALASLTYRGEADYTGGDTLTMTVSDQGNTGAGGALTDSTMVALSLAGVNDAPSFLPGGNVTVLENAGVQTVEGWASAIAAGPADESGQTLTFTVTPDNPGLFAALGGPVIDPGTGTLTFTPAAHIFGMATVSVTLIDDGGTANGGDDRSATASFTITVEDVNTAPSFTKGADQTVNEDAGAQTVTGWATAISAGPGSESAQVLTFTAETSNDALFAAGPALDPATGTLTYTPAPNAYGTVTVTVTLKDNGGTANDGQDTSAPQSFVIDIESVNDAPTLVKGADPTVLEDAGAQAITGWATGISTGPANESGQALTIGLTNSNPGLFAVQPALAPNGTLSFTPANDASGSATVTVTVTDDGGTENDGQNAAVPQTFTITVTPANDRPTFTKGADQTVNEDAGAQTVAGWATAISAGPASEVGQVLTFTAETTNAPLFAVPPAIDPVTGTLTYTPAPNAYGTVTVTVTLQDNGGTANDGQDTSALQSFTLAITGINDVPTFTKGADQTVLEDAGAKVVTGWATGIAAGPANESDQALTFTVTSSNPDLFAVQPALAPNGTLSFTPAANASGTATVTVTLTDDGGTANGGVATSPAQTFAITVTPVNDAPRFTSAPSNTGQMITEGEGLTPLALIDPEGDSITCTVTSGELPPGITLNVDGSFSGLASFGATGTYTAIIRASDPWDYNSTNLVVVVGIADTTPTLAPLSDRENGEGDAVNFSLTATDIDGDSLTYSATGLPSGISINPSTGLISGRLSYSSGGQHTVTVTVTDNTPTPGYSAADRANRSFTWVVYSTNRSPSVAGGSFQVAEGEAWSASLSGSDPDGDSVRFSLAGGSLPVGISLSSSGTLSGKTGYQAAGVYRATVRVTDSSGASATDTVSITVTNTDTRPVLAPVIHQVSQAGQQVSLALSGSDEDQDALTYSASGLPTGLSLNSSTGRISGTPGGEAVGQYTVTATVADTTPGGPNGDSASRSFTWTVTPPAGTSSLSGQLVLSSGHGHGSLPPGVTAEVMLVDEANQANEASELPVGADGRFTATNLRPGPHRVLVRLVAPDGQRLAGVTATVTVGAEGEASLGSILIDPYGTVTDALTGKPVPGVKMRLMWADTPLNREQGREPDTEVQLPALAGFPPAENAVPQWTDAAGFYAWMVFPNSDYYIIAEKEGYLPYDSRREGVIHVGEEIVTHNLTLQPVGGEHRRYVNGYPDGTFRPERELTRAEAAAILSRLPWTGGQQPAIAYSDVAPSHWAAQAIATATARGLMTGDPGGTFRPDAPLTRAEIAVIIVRLKGLAPLPGSTFADAQGHWAQPLIKAVQEARLMQGMPDGSFQPGRSVTRAEFVTAMNRALGRSGVVSGVAPVFSDLPVTHWAFGQVYEASQDHRFEWQPDGTELRATE